MFSGLIQGVTFPDRLPIGLSSPRFQIGQSVRWAKLPPHDQGQILGVVYALETSCQEEGYHYAIKLNENSASRQEGCEADWAFEDDLELWPDSSAASTDLN